MIFYFTSPSHIHVRVHVYRFSDGICLGGTHSCGHYSSSLLQGGLAQWTLVLCKFNINSHINPLLTFSHALIHHRAPPNINIHIDRSCMCIYTHVCIFPICTHVCIFPPSMIIACTDSHYCDDSCCACGDSWPHYDTGALGMEMARHHCMYMHQLITFIKINTHLSQDLNISHQVLGIIALIAVVVNVRPHYNNYNTHYCILHAPHILCSHCWACFSSLSAVLLEPTGEWHNINSYSTLCTCECIK